MSPLGQTLPQKSQLLELLATSMQLPAQHFPMELPSGQSTPELIAPHVGTATHAPLVSQKAPLGQPQVVQVSVFPVEETQVDPQQAPTPPSATEQAVPGAELAQSTSDEQIPWSQKSPAGHLWPQTPQLFGSDTLSLQVPAQHEAAAPLAGRQIRPSSSLLAQGATQQPSGANRRWLSEPAVNI